MQDARIRLICTVTLSFASFMSVGGAIFAILWWVVFTPGIRTFRKSSFAPVFLLLAGLVAVLVEVSGGDGVSYFIRMLAVLLIAMYAYFERYPGEFLDLSVWLFGKGAGFDIGTAAEMSLQAVDSVAADMQRIRLAYRLKGLAFGIRTIIPMASVLVHGHLARAEDQADLLYVRGYSRGGSCCPEFHMQKTDLIALFCAIIVISIAFFFVGDIFILRH